MNTKILKNWEEAVGDLTGIKDDDLIITLEFTTVWKVDVPKISKNLTNKLKNMIGKRIGVIKTDIPGKEVLVREIKNKRTG